jgi:hypothetical protein
MKNRISRVVSRVLDTRHNSQGTYLKKYQDILYVKVT